MKNKILIGALAIIMCFIVTACRKEIEKLKCDDNELEKNGRCVAVEKVSPKFVYECPKNAILNQNSLTCLKEIESIDAINNPTCPSGYSMNGTNCTTTSTVEYTITKICAGGDGVVSGDKCKYYDSYGNYQYSLPVALKKGCPSGYSDSGTNCVYTSSISVTNNYSCQEGYTLSGSKCIKTELTDAQKVAKCEVGFELIDNNCIKFLDDVNYNEKTTNNN